MEKNNDKNYSTDKNPWHQGATIKDHLIHTGKYEEVKDSQEPTIPAELQELHAIAAEYAFRLGSRRDAHEVRRFIEWMTDNKDRNDTTLAPLSPEAVLAKFTKLKSLPAILETLAYGDPIITTWRKEAVTHALTTCAKEILSEKEKEQKQYEDGTLIPPAIAQWRRAEMLFVSQVQYEIVQVPYHKHKVVIPDTEQNRANPRYRAYFLNDMTNFTAYMKAENELHSDEEAIRFYVDEQDRKAEAQQIVSRMTPEEREQAADPNYVSQLLTSTLAEERKTLHFLKGERNKPGERVEDDFRKISDILKLVHLLPIEEREKWELKVITNRLRKEQNDLKSFLDQFNTAAPAKSYTPVNSA